jgi:hypothetical protein
MTMTMARRLAPFAERQLISIAIHNQVDGNHDRAMDCGTAAAASRSAKARRYARCGILPRRHDLGLTIAFTYQNRFGTNSSSASQRA